MEIESAVRIPSPEPERPRKRSPPSRSPSPRRYRSPPRGRQPSPPKPVTEEQKQAAAKAEYEKLLNMRSGGTYIPPARLRALQAQITDKTSKEYQRMAWEALKKSINGLINKVNVSNIKFIVPELFNENLIRGRGLFCRSIMKAQAASLPFTPIYAAMAAIVNTKLPQVGELLVTRLVVQFRKAFKRNDKAVCLSSTTFLAHLVNQQVVHEMLAAQILLLLLHKPTDDSVEIAVGLTREVGQHLEEMSQPIALAVFDQFRNILHEADIDKRTQYMVEVLFQVRKDKYKDNPSVREELDLVEEEDQITHKIGLDDELEVQDGLNIFKFDSEWQEHEDAYKQLKAEILGEAEGSDDDDEYESDDSSDEEEEKKDRELEIKDQTNTDLVNLRRTIYLTIKSSGGFEECCHKLMKINLPAGYESELPSMIVECASQERTYDKFYGLIGERFAKLNRLWRDLFEESFIKYYNTIHRYDTNRLRIIAQFCGHLLASDAIGWHVLSAIRLNENDTTSSSRIFIKILFEDLAQSMGMKKLAERMKEDVLQPYFDGIFPKDESRNTRFAINFFTAIGMASPSSSFAGAGERLGKRFVILKLLELQLSVKVLFKVAVAIQVTETQGQLLTVSVEKPSWKESVKVGVPVAHSRSSPYGPLVQWLGFTIPAAPTQTSHVIDVSFSVAKEERAHEGLAVTFAHPSAHSTQGSQPLCVSFAQPASPQEP
ncbi:MIF4G-like type 3 [Lasiodiplodia theobromae]|nr:MIF4G-like type 3 [Lasiodiplodia theobromae]